MKTNAYFIPFKVGDQILDVNGINFLGIVHSDAAHALRAQPCMVLKLKDVGKLPHSRVTTLGKTQWHPTAQGPGSGSRSVKPCISNTCVGHKSHSLCFFQDSPT